MDYTFEVSTLELNAQLPTVDFIRIAVINSDPLALSLGLGDCSVLYHRSMQVGTLSLPIGSSTGSVFLDPMIWAISAAVAQLQLRPVDVRTGTLFASTGFPLSIGLPAASVLLKRALTASPLALQATLGSVGYRRGAPLWSISALGIQLRLNTVNISYTSFYEIPLQVPTSREFTPPSHSLTQARTQSGTVVQRVWASRPGGGSLRLGFANIADASAQQLAGIWDRAKGRLYSVVLPEKLFQGMSQELLDHFQLNGSPLKWAFAKKPVITSVMPGVSSVEMEFTARGYGGQAIPVVTEPEPPRVFAIQPLALIVSPSEAAIRIQSRNFSVSTIPISLQLSQVGVSLKGGFYASPLQLALQLASVGFNESAVTDPSWSSVSLLLSFDGSNGSTLIADTSSNANTISVFGAASITTVDKQYGTGSLNIGNSAGAYVQTPASSLFQLGTGDFTVEFWANPLSNQGNQGLFTFGATSSGLFLAIFNGNWMLGTAGSGGTNMGGAVTGWQHVAVTRSGTSLRLFIGGAQKGGTLTNSTNLSDSQLKIGYYFNTSYPFNGRLDEFRVTKGIARYTTAFTPSGPFPLS